MIFKALYRQIINIIFPPLCLSCQTNLPQERIDLAICRACENEIEILSGFYCPECKRRLPEAKKFCHPETKFILAACADYQNKVVQELIHVLKYQKLKSALAPLARIIKPYAASTLKNPADFVFVPIPLHPARERERGFNQAKLIAGLLSPQIHSNNLVRIKNTKSQVEMKNYNDREKNIAGSFCLKNPELIKGKSIVLVDDVFTSGATMKEAARVLKSAGAKTIIGFVVAKA
jgi:ComF family protein